LFCEEILEHFFHDSASGRPGARAGTQKPGPAWRRSGQKLKEK
jgi:hypothetical protein